MIKRLMRLLYHTMHVVKGARKYYNCKLMIKFAPTPKPRPGERWVDHAAELPSSSLRKMFDGHMIVQISALNRRAKQARAAKQVAAHQLAGGAVAAMEVAKNTLTKLPTGDSSKDRNLAYNSLSALAMGRLVSRFLGKDVEHLFGLVEAGTLAIQPEVFYNFENEEEPARYSLHASRELLAPQVDAPLPQFARERWYLAAGLYLRYQSPPAPLDITGGGLTLEEAAEAYVGTCTLRPFLAMPPMQ
jgi:hypothetical protein